MSYTNKPNRPDSEDTARLRAEYEAKAKKIRETTFNNATERDKAIAEKQKAFQKVVAQMNGERAEDLASLHKVLIKEKRLKSPEQMAAEKAAAAQKK